jgi:transcriptional regulator with XRE-family HTH domain
MTSAAFSELDAHRDEQRRKELSAFLSGKRREVNPNARRVGTYIRRQNRIGRPFTQEEVAEALDVSRQWYAALEMGASVRPSTALLDRIATVFAFSEDERVTLFSLAIREFCSPLQSAGSMLNGFSPALPYASPVSSPAELEDAAHALAVAREKYMLTGSVAGTVVRSRIVASWKRCRALGVDPNAKTLPVYDDVAERRAANERLLRAADPMLVHLAAELEGTGFVVEIADADGRLLDVAGDRETRRVLDRVGCVPGADWSEEASGTNAIGTALADHRALQMLAAEHFCESALPFMCAAAPIYAPRTREIVGVLDMTGRYKLTRTHLLATVMQAVLDIEERLALTLED